MSQLTNYIEKELARGFSKDLIRKKLLQAGYTDQEINESFTSISSASPVLTRKIPDKLPADHHFAWSKWVFAILGIAVLVFFVVLVYSMVDFSSISFDSVGDSSPKECNDLTGSDKDLCLLELARVGDADCSLISSDMLRTSCEQAIWQEDNCLYETLMGESFAACSLEKARESGNTGHCISLNEDRSDCFYDIASSQNDVGLCGDDFGCVLQMAIDAADGSLCLDLAFSANCVTAYADATGDDSSCSDGTEICGYSALSSEAEKKTFIENMIATYSSTPEEAGEPSDRDEVLIAYAQEYSDSLFCSYVSAEFSADCQV